MITLNEALNKGMDAVMINGKTYVFTNMRVERKSVPDELYVYDVRDDDDCSGVFANIKEFVMVNHWGTIIGQVPLPLDENGTYWCEEEDGQFIEHFIRGIIYIQNGSPVMLCGDEAKPGDRCVSVANI